TWMITVTRNTAIDALRRRRGGEEDIADHSHRLAGSEPSPEQAALAGDEARRIRDCFEELGDDKARAVRGAYLDGYSYAELSQQLGIPLNTIRTWLRRGLQALQECMNR
ncbi:sigma-70 family RNA polymerase sigma factor, partial [Cribrihabitans sp. XS_ASV171]